MNRAARTFLIGMALAFAAAPAAADQVVVNKCAEAVNGVWLAAIERGGSCAGCLTMLSPGASRGRFLKHLLLGERATLRTPRSDAARFYIYPAGRYLGGLETPRDAELEIVADAPGRCVVRTATSSIPSWARR